MNFKLILPLLALCAFVFSCDVESDSVAEAQERNEEILKSEQLEEDAEYLTEFAYDLMLSNNVAKTMDGRTENDSVRNFVTTVLQDNEKIEQAMQRVAKEHNIMLPQKLDTDAMETIHDFQTADVDNIDEKYLEWFVDHTKDAREDINEIIAETNKTESILQLANLIATQQFVHIELANRMLPRLASYEY
ncbi:MAG: DUF4142 domain-containing protein [Bacteroidota bacterium]